jgi:hypothetical protein
VHFSGEGCFRVALRVHLGDVFVEFEAHGIWRLSRRRMQFDDASNPPTSLVVETIKGGFPACSSSSTLRRSPITPTRES